MSIICAWDLRFEPPYFWLFLLWGTVRLLLLVQDLSLRTCCGGVWGQVIFFWVKVTAETDETAQGRPTSSGTGTALSAPKLILNPQQLRAVFILQLTQQHLILPRWFPIQVLTNCLTSVIVGTGDLPLCYDAVVYLYHFIRRQNSPENDCLEP